MANVWPPSLPQIQLLGSTEKTVPQFIETKMDVGPPKRRRVSQVDYGRESIPLLFNATEVGVFRTFWTTTLTDGIDSFEWEDLVNDTTVDYEILDYPQFRLVSGGAALGDRRWRATLKLRRLP